MNGRSGRDEGASGSAVAMIPAVETSPAPLRGVRSHERAAPIPWVDASHAGGLPHVSPAPVASLIQTVRRVASGLIRVHPVARSAPAAGPAGIAHRSDLWTGRPGRTWMLG